MQGIINIRKQTVNILTVLSEVSSFVGNPLSRLHYFKITEERRRYIKMCDRDHDKDHDRDHMIVIMRKIMIGIMLVIMIRLLITFI